MRATSRVTCGEGAKGGRGRERERRRKIRETEIIVHRDIVPMAGVVATASLMEERREQNANREQCAGKKERFFALKGEGSIPSPWVETDGVCRAPIFLFTRISISPLPGYSILDSAFKIKNKENHSFDSSFHARATYNKLDVLPRVQSSPIIAKSGTVHLSTFRHSELQLKARKSIAAGIYSGNCARRGGMQREFEIDRRYESAKE